LWVRREAIMAPTVGKPTPSSMLSAQWAKTGTLGRERFKI
jgi:hypothetical protein